ncbi:hypothetical protein VST63_04735 [Mycolicibacterium sp. 050232]|uniref:hypothetical protein n=1 Tax=Mycolicibacterium sp. 050232 TaxID=3113982 RepID=UPI002E2B91D1|nr:hypothetical protein [Mycolicibacterium sp. 050232]MED5811657.1 hypothetical protein [Mycolicibacterium sp. 050232]
MRGTTVHYEMVDLVRERANEKDWDLIFDSGPNAEYRTMVWEHPLLSATGVVTELEIGFSPDGRIIFSERRRGGVAHKRVKPTSTFASTDLYLAALKMI